ncbi:hypothetical protein NKG94_28395 [Micromonospora sp. M12]
MLRTLTDAGANVKKATQKVLDEPSIDAFLAYLNNGLYAAREDDCKAQPTATPTSQPTKPSATPAPRRPLRRPLVPPPAQVRPAAGRRAALTGAGTATMAGIGGVLLVLGGVGYVLGRRRRARFVA